MDKQMKFVAVISLLLTVFLSVLFIKSGIALFETLAITCGTVAYHFCVRLVIGGIFNKVMNNRADYHRWWYQARAWEDKLYRKLRVKQWKKYLPTYSPENFSVHKNRFDELAQVMCQSELVHEINMICSFFPLFAALVFGEFLVFLITSVLAACFDFCFVIMQRYNRPRVIKLAEYEKKMSILNEEEETE